MDFKAKMEELEQSVATRVSKQTVEISQIESNIAELEKSISTIERAIEKHVQKHAQDIAEIATKKELIAQWKVALDEHETNLQANKMLVNINVKIEHNQDSIDQSLIILQNQKVEIEKAIDDFKTKNPHINEINQDSLQVVRVNKGSLQNKLEEKNLELKAVQNKIDSLLDLEKKMYGFVKLFLALLELIGWRTNPKAIEQEKLRSLNTAIDDITQSIISIQSYIELQESLVKLESQKSTVGIETEEMLNQKSTLTLLQNTQKAISESEQTIKALKKQIEDANQQCDTLINKINDKSYLSTIKPQESLRQELAEKMALLQVKKQELGLIQDPKRTELRNQFAARLITITSERAEHIQKKEALAKNSQFFKSLSTENPTTLANNAALTKLILSIKKYAKNLDESGSEAITLSEIAKKLILWQIAENSTNLNIPCEGRIKAYDIFHKEMEELIAKLPMDNPLNAALNLIQDITTPTQPAPSQQTMNSSSYKTSKKPELRG
jgi:hypothetical protein